MENLVKHQKVSKYYENDCRVQSPAFRVQRPTLASRVQDSGMTFGMAISDKLTECIFENSEIPRVKQGQFQNFQKSGGSFIPKIARTKHVVTG